MSLINRDTSDLFFNILPFRGPEKGINNFKYWFKTVSPSDVRLHFEDFFHWNLKDHKEDFERFIEEFEEEYQKYFGYEVTSFSPPFIFTLGKIYSNEHNLSISTSAFGYINEFEESFFINRNGDIVYLTEQILDIHRDEFKLFFLFNEDEIDQIECWEDDCEEVYPDLVIELRNKEYLNDQGFYRELYLEMIEQIFE